jgi:hypothetical protein
MRVLFGGRITTGFPRLSLQVCFAFACVPFV